MNVGAVCLSCQTPAPLGLRTGTAPSTSTMTPTPSLGATVPGVAAPLCYTFSIYDLPTFPRDDQHPLPPSLVPDAPDFNQVIGELLAHLNTPGVTDDLADDLITHKKFPVRGFVHITGTPLPMWLPTQAIHSMSKGCLRTLRQEADIRYVMPKWEFQLHDPTKQKGSTIWMRAQEYFRDNKMLPLSPIHI